MQKSFFLLCALLALLTSARGEEETPLLKRIAAENFAFASYASRLMDDKGSLIVSYDDSQLKPFFRIVFGSTGKKGEAAAPLGIWLVENKGEKPEFSIKVEPGSPLETALIKLMEKSLKMDQNGNLRATLVLLRQRPERYQAMYAELKLRPFSSPH